MMHSAESMAAEYERLRHRSGAGAAPPVLGEFTVDVPDDPADYVARLRSVVSAAVGRGATADFEEGSLPTDDVPVWFADISDGVESRAPDHAKRGRDAYTEHTGGRPWTLQNWLYRFHPDEDSRGWQWWDVTSAGQSRVRIWVDCWGESFFGCQELLWAAYTAGARHVEGPLVRRADAWVAEAAEGSFDAP
jgi:hypothetical protein